MLPLETSTPTMLLSSGSEFDPTDLSTFTVRLPDITHALPRIQRFGGHTRRPLSVAQHSMHVADLVAEIEPKWRLEALLHDASEAYLGDIPKPLKNVLPDYQRLERQVEHAIQRHFDLDPQAWTLVKQMDQLALEVELDWHAKRSDRVPPYLGLDVGRAFLVDVYDAMSDPIRDRRSGSRDD